jgi:hypothetical protein
MARDAGMHLHSKLRASPITRLLIKQIIGGLHSLLPVFKQGLQIHKTVNICSLLACVEKLLHKCER